MNYLESVSYTHLDVYKRQVQLLVRDNRILVPVHQSPILARRQSAPNQPKYQFTEAVGVRWRWQIRSNRSGGIDSILLPPIGAAGPTFGELEYYSKNRLYRSPK